MTSSEQTLFSFWKPDLKCKSLRNSEIIKWSVQGGALGQPMSKLTVKTCVLMTFLS